jgi:hypothetical protein
MVILNSLVSAAVLLMFFALLGLGVTNARGVKKDLVLLPVFGYAALIGLSYFISANFKLSGSSSVGWAIILLCSSFLLRIRSFSGVLSTLKKQDFSLFLIIAAIPICTLLLPAVLAGFKFFFGYVNYDFFYNSQDSWFLKSHNVLQFGEGNQVITPLNWSASYSGRIGVGILGAYFSNILNLGTLQFNSLLLNTVVILFALSMSVFCKEFFKLNNKQTLVAVFFSVMSAGYAQAYCYYVLGQISVTPVFIIFCIFLKRFIDSVIEQSSARTIYFNAFAVALLLNVMFVIYAIMCFFGIVLTGLSYLICLRGHFNKNNIILLAKLMVITLTVFCIVRILMVHESIDIIKSWIHLSNRVANGVHQDNSFIVFSEYITESFLALFFGITNYVSTHSVFSLLTSSNLIRNFLLISGGMWAFLTTLFVMRSFSISKEASIAARVIVISLFSIAFILGCYFFYSLSAYGIFKLQSWFIPIIIPIFVYFIFKKESTKFHLLLKLSCSFILILNLAAAVIYLADFFGADVNKHFVNARGINGGHDLRELIQQLNDKKSDVSLFLTNGLEVAWSADLMRHIKLDKVIHNTQPLIEKEFTESACAKKDDINWTPSQLLVFYNQNIITKTDIVDPPKGTREVYKNDSYVIFDASQLQTLMFIGAGAYPVEYSKGDSKVFPTKFRWVEKGIEIMIYSNKNKAANLALEVTPGFVQNKSDARNITINTLTHQYHFSINAKTTLTVPDIKLHKGLNCLTVESPDPVSRLARYGSFVRHSIPLDPRLNNFAISNITLH